TKCLSAARASCRTACSPSASACPTACTLATSRDSAPWPRTWSRSTIRCRGAGPCARKPAPRAAVASSTASPGTEARRQPLDGREVGAVGAVVVAAVTRRRLGLLVVAERVVQAVPRAADGEAFLVEEFADAADEQHLVVLVVAPIAAALDGLQLGKFLLPIAQHVRLHAPQVAHLTDSEVALRRDRRELSLPAAWLHAVLSPPRPLASGWRGRCTRGAR